MKYTVLNVTHKYENNHKHGYHVHNNTTLKVSIKAALHKSK